MKINTERKKLKHLYEELKDLSFPKFSSQDKLSDWIEELIEVDAHYAGLSLSIAEGEKKSKYNLYDLVKLRKALELIQSKNPEESKEDLEIIENGHNHLKKLEEIHFLLKRISD